MFPSDTFHFLSAVGGMLSTESWRKYGEMWEARGEWKMSEIVLAENRRMYGQEK